MVIYVPSLALSGVTSLPLVPTIVAVGILTTAYTAVGGMKAVIWTDVAQFFVMLGGAVLAIWIATLRLPGGLSQIWYSGAAELAGRSPEMTLAVHDANPVPRGAPDQITRVLAAHGQRIVGHGRYPNLLSAMLDRRDPGSE